MKVLVVCSKNSGKVAPFISEQVNALQREGIITDYFTIEQKGWRGYLKSRKFLLSKIKSFQPDVVHAHYGLAGLLANLQRKVPVVTTYHGSDINNDKVFFFSKLSIRLSKHNIFVSQKNIEKAKVNKCFSLIPCGVDTDFFVPKDKQDARQCLQLDANKRYILFAGAFDNRVKNASLAKQAVKALPNTILLELKGYSREEVVLLMNAVDCCLMTSYTEGSPQFIKEAMACNCPIVSVDVGDVKEVVGNSLFSYICSIYDATEIAQKIELVLSVDKRADSRMRINELHLGNKSVAKRLIDIYQQICGKNIHV